MTPLNDGRRVVQRKAGSRGPLLVQIGLRRKTEEGECCADVRAEAYQSFGSGPASFLDSHSYPVLKGLACVGRHQEP